MKKRKQHEPQVKFEKYHGLGNDFIFISHLKLKQFKTLPELKNFVIKICQRNYSIGADGVIFFRISKSIRIKNEILIINSDGSLAGTCGNALRCLGLKLFRDGVWTGKKSIPIFRLAILLSLRNSLQQEELFANDTKKSFSTLLALQPRAVTGPWLEQQSISRQGAISGSNYTSANVDILFAPSKDIYYWNENRNKKTSEVTNAVFVQLENPHIVFFSSKFQNFNCTKFAEFGTQVQRTSNVNVGMLAVDLKTKLRNNIFSLHVYERGAGLTLACGSGAVASALALQFSDYILDNNQPITLKMPGGIIKIHLGNQIKLSAQAEFVFSGKIL